MTILHAAVLCEHASAYDAHMQNRQWSRLLSRFRMCVCAGAGRVRMRNLLRSRDKWRFYMRPSCVNTLLHMIHACRIVLGLDS